jgi:hypothetical protein
VTGVCIAICTCFACGRRFMADPDEVPAVVIDPVTQLPPDLGGDPDRAYNHPLCPLCAVRVNRERARQGKAAHWSVERIRRAAEIAGIRL